jgi:hypothetical protein
MMFTVTLHRTALAGALRRAGPARSAGGFVALVAKQRRAA